MFELSATKVEQGVFSYEFDKPPPFFMRPFLSLGPIRGRLVAMALLAGAFFLKIKTRQDLIQLEDVSNVATGGVWNLLANVCFVLAALIYVHLIFFRKESFHLEIDRPSQQLRYAYTGFFQKMQPKQGIVPFSKVKAIKVYAPQREPRTPHGYIELDWQTEGPIKSIKFKLLSDEQFAIYPKNLSTLLGVEPKGDYLRTDDKSLEIPKR